MLVFKTGLELQASKTPDLHGFNGKFATDALFAESVDQPPKMQLTVR